MGCCGRRVAEETRANRAQSLPCLPSPPAASGGKKEKKEDKKKEDEGKWEMLTDAFGRSYW